MSEKSEESPTWIHTEFVEAGPKSEDGWPQHQLYASINPRLDWVEVRASLKHEGVMIRLPKEEFVKWVAECQEVLSRQAANPADTGQ